MSGQRKSVTRQRAAVWTLLIVALAVLSAASATGQSGAKIGLIDVNRLVVESEHGKTTMEKLRTLKAAKQAEGEELGAEAKSLKERLDAGRLTLSEEALAEMEKQLEDKLIELRRFEADAQRELEKAEQSAFTRIQDKVMPLIAEIGKEGGYTLIFNKFESGLVYADEQADITEAVLKRLDQDNQDAD